MAVVKNSVAKFCLQEIPPFGTNDGAPCKGILPYGQNDDALCDNVMVGSSGFAAASYHPLHLETPVIPNEAERNEESHHIICGNDGIPLYGTNEGFYYIAEIKDKSLWTIMFL